MKNKLRDSSFFSDNVNAKRKFFKIFKPQLIIGNEYSHKFDFNPKENKSVHLYNYSKDNSVGTYELMQMNKSHITNLPSDEKTVYLEPEFTNYPMYASKQLNNLYKTHDGRRSRDNLRMKEKSKMLQARQNSTKDLIESLKRVASKRLTHRNNKRMAGLYPSRKSHKCIKNYNNITASHNKFTNKENLSFASPKKRSKKSIDKNQPNQKVKYFPNEIKTNINKGEL